MTTVLARPSARLGVGLLVPVMLVLWWQWQATAVSAHGPSLAPLSVIGSSLLTLASSGELVTDVLATVSRSVIGLVVGGSLGIVIGIAMAMWRPLDRLLGPSFNALRQVPLIGWLPLIGLWCGTGEGSELTLVSVSAFFPAMLGSHEGIAQAEGRYVEVGQIYGFSPAQRFRHILLPGAMPLILTGITQALAFAWIGAVATEILSGAGDGLGVAMETAQIQQRMDVIMAIVLVTAIVGFTLNHVLVRLRRHLLRWQGDRL